MDIREERGNTLWKTDDVSRRLQQRLSLKSDRPCGSIQSVLTHA